jgi:hypothetical protein
LVVQLNAFLGNVGVWSVSGTSIVLANTNCLNIDPNWITGQL